MDQYRQIVRDFLAHLGPKARASIAAVSPADLTSFRNRLQPGKAGRRQLAIRSSRGFLTVLPNWPTGLAISRPIRFQPWSLSVRRDEERAEREPFTALEVSRASGECARRLVWRYPARRDIEIKLGDVMYLRWESVDLENRLLRVSDQKDGQAELSCQCIAISKPGIKPKAARDRQGTGIPFSWLPAGP